jgi:hypothetical protein
MSAHAYIQWTDIPHRPISSSCQRVDDATGAKLIAFEGCPLTGKIDQVGDRLQVEFPFPRNRVLRDELIGWLMHWGISFTVAM